MNAKPQLPVVAREKAPLDTLAPCDPLVPKASNTVDLGSPPYDPEAEAAVLACVLIDSALMTELASALRPDDLWGVRERFIYEAMLRLHAAGKPVDVILLAGDLNDHRQLDRRGDGDAVCVHHLIDLATATLPLAHVEHMQFYLARVIEVSRLRRARQRGMKLIEAAYRAQRQGRRK